MTLADAVGIGTKDLGTRVRLVTALPTVAVALWLILLVWSGAPGAAPDPGRAQRTAQHLGGADIALLAIGLLLVIVLTHPLQLPLVRLLEGYGGSKSPAAPIRWILLSLRRRHWKSLQRVQQSQTETEKKRQAAAWKLIYTYPQHEAAVMPTLLGNVLRAAEENAGARYGIDAIIAWPRILPLLSANLTAALQDQRNQLDLACRFCVTTTAGAVATAALLITHIRWLGVSLVPLALAVIAYRGAVISARAYGESIKAAFDLHRFDLLKALHLPLPNDRAQEKSANSDLYLFLGQGAPVNLAYDHGGQEGATVSSNINADFRERPLDPAEFVSNENGRGHKWKRSRRTRSG